MMKTSYDEAAGNFDAHASQSAWNAYADRPAVMSLLPGLKGLRVLDAGCGSGLYCGPLLDRGADVYAFDSSATMVEIARQRYGDRIDFKVLPLEELSDHYASSYFDVVLSTLVLDHIQNLEEVFLQIHDVLKPGGYFVFSLSHPFRIFEEYGQIYFQQERYNLVFPNVGAAIPAFRRPLEAYIRPLLEIGFCLVDFVETRPTEECKLVHPESYERMLKKPTMMILKWRKPNKTAGGDA
jgi:2-polyprenyl-3-methyl-5-hydroxy-6-metoxy-1,4-benzoquinol methylase